MTILSKQKLKECKLRWQKMTPDQKVEWNGFIGFLKEQRVSDTIPKRYARGGI